jgi:hypothetical protein
LPGTEVTWAHGAISLIVRNELWGEEAVQE